MAVGIIIGFIAKLNSSGSDLVYSTYLGGSVGEIINGIALDSAGNAYVTGLTLSGDFPTTLNAFQAHAHWDLSVDGIYTGFISKLNTAGSSLVYSTYLGGSGGDIGQTIALDGSGNAYVGGLTESVDFPVTNGAFQTTFHATDGTGFVTKLNPSGTALEYSTYLGGSYAEAVWAIESTGRGMPT